eukprot:COSAG02_NODE_13034_length_1456_cov_18.295505_1_plen_447_part_01
MLAEERERPHTLGCPRMASFEVEVRSNFDDEVDHYDGQVIVRSRSRTSETVGNALGTPCIAERSNANASSERGDSTVNPLSSTASQDDKDDGAVVGGGAATTVVNSSRRAAGARSGRCPGGSAVPGMLVRKQLADELRPLLAQCANAFDGLPRAGPGGAYRTVAECRAAMLTLCSPRSSEPTAFALREMSPWKYHVLCAVCFLPETVVALLVGGWVVGLDDRFFGIIFWIFFGFTCTLTAFSLTRLAMHLLIVGPDWTLETVTLDYLRKRWRCCRWSRGQRRSSHHDGGTRLPIFCDDVEALKFGHLATFADENESPLSDEGDGSELVSRDAFIGVCIQHIVPTSTIGEQDFRLLSDGVYPLRYNTQKLRQLFVEMASVSVAPSGAIDGVRVGGDGASTVPVRVLAELFTNTDFEYKREDVERIAHELSVPDEMSYSEFMVFCACLA